MDSNRADESLRWLETLARENIRMETVPASFYFSGGVQWDVLRTDLIHPVCSGNKFFKLKYYLLDAIQKNHTMISTYGGAWSNHIVATAFAAKACGLQSKGIIRGERPATLSDTLLEAESMGMELEFVSREQYARLCHATRLSATAGEPYPIPPGGFGLLGARGAGEILDFAVPLPYSHIVCACGTGTMTAGLSLAAPPSAQTIGITVLKHPELQRECEPLAGGRPFKILHDFHHGGYAKKTPELLAFMNRFHAATGIPTDFVYTGKLMMAIFQLIQQQYFPNGSRILSIHSGGLQGNKSLKKQGLEF